MPPKVGLKDKSHTISNQLEIQRKKRKREDNDIPNVKMMRTNDGKAVQTNSDTEDGRTLFVRNLSIDNEIQTLKDLFKQFGEIEYVLIVRNQQTQRPTGSAFIRFKDVAQARVALHKCLVTAQNSGSKEGLTINGRTLVVCPAVSRDRIAEVIESQQQGSSYGGKKKAKETDPRNLYLAREGSILPNTPAAKGMVALDWQLRNKVESKKRQKLANIQDTFVSTTRLCVHNIPFFMTDDAFRLMCLNAAKAGKQLEAQKEKSKQTKQIRGRTMQQKLQNDNDEQDSTSDDEINQQIDDVRVSIKQAIIVREKVNSEGGGIGRSKGFAFVEFNEHEDALACLRMLNNNPDALDLYVDYRHKVELAKVIDDLHKPNNEDKSNKKENQQMERDEDWQEEDEMNDFDGRQ
ncbi:MAG: putative RNA-binding protein 28 [Streblomastix strix]|uniref:Putative RNA-binding protein 28 n=1 Tax=Streblomastix strix TaxID=222440 RepID=A0A5J4V048_9EUKA|nr:MAG: putative RNA-binding protein 28 [Streblomastix strix]